jgi:predicted GTPase
MGYSAEQLQDLTATIAAVACDTVVVATPVDLTRLIPLPHPYCRVQYELKEISQPDVAQVVEKFLREHAPR